MTDIVDVYAVAPREVELADGTIAERQGFKQGEHGDRAVRYRVEDRRVSVPEADLVDDPATAVSAVTNGYDEDEWVDPL